jgi:hypothetical protein
MEESQQQDLEAGFSTSSVESQLAALRAWETRTGQTSSTAETILLDYKKPMTKEKFIRTENPAWEPLDVLADSEWIEEMFPDFLLSLPDEEAD